MGDNAHKFFEEQEKFDDKFANAEQELFEGKIKRSYYFGQFFIMHILAKMLQMYGAEKMSIFLDSRYKQFTKQFPNFYNQMVSTDKRAVGSVEADYERMFRKQLDDQIKDETKL